MSGRGRGFPRTTFEDCPLLVQLLEDFHIDRYLIQSRYAATDRRSYAKYKCPVCQNFWGSGYGWFTIDIKAPAVRRWGQCCRRCHSAENQYYLSEAMLPEDRLESLLIKAINSIIDKWHRPLKTDLLEERFQGVRTYEQELAKAARERAEQGDSRRTREEHNTKLCEKCKYGGGELCWINSPRQDD